MIAFKEARDRLKSEYGFACNLQDYTFCVYSVIGLNTVRSYLYSVKAQESVNERGSQLVKSEEIYKREAAKYERNEYVQRLKVIIEESYKTDIASYITRNPNLFSEAFPHLSNSDDGEDLISQKMLKTIYVSLLTKMRDEPDYFKGSEAATILKLGIDKFSPDDDDNVNKHIIMAYPRCNTICPVCNRETYALFGNKTTCDNCGEWLAYDDKGHYIPPKQ